MEKKETFQKLCQQAEKFAIEQGLETIFVDTNMQETLPERFGDVYSFRNIACVLAVVKLFSVYLISSGPNASKLDLDLRKCARFDILTVHCASTESLSFYLCGIETTRIGKIAALTRWEPSRRWLHPCIGIIGENINCSHCKKCIRDMTVLYALGELEHYKAVFDTEDYLRHLSERLGYVLAAHDSNVCNQIRALLVEQNISIPPAAYRYERQFRLAMQNLKAMQKGE